MSKVLLVEDSATQAMQIQMLLKESAHDVTLAGDGEEAIRLLENAFTDVVVTDLAMPRMTGLELVEKMRLEYPTVPAILVTSRGSEDLAVEALRRGAAAYVPKNRLAALLNDTIADVLGVMRADRSYATLVECLDRSSFSFSIPNEVRLINPLVDLVLQVTTGMRLIGGIELVRLGVALEHALLNALYRGNLELGRDELPEGRETLIEGIEPNPVEQRRSAAPYADRKIHVDASISSSAGVRVTVRDEGPGFDTRRVPAPGDPNALDDEAGRGLVLMTSFMDDVAFNEAGNEVTLIKRPPPSE